MEPQLHSIHLETTSRRDAFRRARDVLSAALGEKTLTGHSHFDDRDNHDTPPGLTIPSIASLFWRGKSWELRLGINTIGRLPDNQICLDDPSVSRRHCAIVVHSDDHIEVYDIASTAGPPGLRHRGGTAGAGRGFCLWHRAKVRQRGRCPVRGREIGRAHV